MNSGKRASRPASSARDGRYRKVFLRLAAGKRPDAKAAYPTYPRPDAGSAKPSVTMGGRSNWEGPKGVDGRRDTFEDCRPAAAHALEGFFSERRIEVKSALLEVQTRAAVFRLKSPGDRRIERSGSEA
jgi:hypothetical protein